MTRVTQGGSRHRMRFFAALLMVIVLPAMAYATVHTVTLENNLSTVTIPSGTNSGDIVLDVGYPCAFTNEVDTMADEDLPGLVPPVPADAGFTHPFGLVKFQVICDLSTTIEAYVTITFPGDISGMTYRKYGPTPPYDNSPGSSAHWYAFAPQPARGGAFAKSARVTQNSVTLYLVDGQLGDDTDIDGIIYDDGGPGQPNAAVAAPTMTEWGVIIFMALAGVGAVFNLRRQRKPADPTS